jgi:hypothetical protein
MRGGEVNAYRGLVRKAESCRKGMNKKTQAQLGE